MLLVNELEDAGLSSRMVLSGKARAALAYGCFHALSEFLEDFKMFGAQGSGSRGGGGVVERQQGVRDFLLEYTHKRGMTLDETEELLSMPSIKRVNPGIQNPKP